MKKLIIIDVGTHEAQEFKALFHLRVWDYLYNWLRHLNRIRRAGGEACSLSTFTSMLSDAAWLRTQRNSVYYILVEPNRRLCSLPVYAKADMFANIALASESKTFALRKLYFSNSGKLGQGSSLFIEKPNVVLSDFDWVLSIDPEHFFTELMEQLADHGNINLVLRLNNEGAETEVIEAAHKVFGEKLIGILGSLSDVEKVKGPVAMRKLKSFIDDRNISFLPFHSDFATWPKALAFIRDAVSSV